MFLAYSSLKSNLKLKVPVYLCHNEIQKLVRTSFVTFYKVCILSGMKTLFLFPPSYFKVCLSWASLSIELPFSKLKTSKTILSPLSIHHSSHNLSSKGLHPDVGIVVELREVGFSSSPKSHPGPLKKITVRRTSQKNSDISTAILNISKKKSVVKLYSFHLALKLGEITKESLKKQIFYGQADPKVALADLLWIFIFSLNRAYK